MLRLKSKLLSLNTNKPAHLKTKVFSPPNCEELRIPIRMDKTAKVVGKLADRIRLNNNANSNSKVEDGAGDGTTISDKNVPVEDQVISGVLVQNDLQLSLMDPEDLREYAGLTTTVITCRQKITLAAAGIELIRWALEGTFGGIVDLNATKKEEEGATKTENGTDGDDAAKIVKKEDEDADEEVDRSVYRFLIMDTVTLTYRNQGEIEIEWEGNMINDGIADAVMSVLLTVESSPAAVKRKFKHPPFPTCPLSNKPTTNAPHATESSKLNTHSHSHSHSHGQQQNGTTKSYSNPHSNTTLTPEEKLSRLFMFLEAQFGADNVAPIARPPLPLTTSDPGITKETTNSVTESPDFSPEEIAELTRLHSLGIPVPGISITVDKLVARVWLEGLRVECAGSAVLRDRVGRVVQRAVECLSGLV